MASRWARRLVRATRDYLDAVRDPHPPSHRLLASFSSPSDLARWNVFSDAEHGGSTAASLLHSRLFPGTAEFRGVLAGAGAAGRARAGFAGMTVQLGGLGGEEDEGSVSMRTDSSDNGNGGGGGGGGGGDETRSSSSPSSSHPPVDLSAFDALRLRVRNGDGRPWVVSLRTENWLVGDAGGGGCHDVWQAFLFAPDARRAEAGASSRSGGASGGASGRDRGSEGPESQGGRNGWTTAELPLSRFLLTHRGRLVEARVSMNAARVVSLGLAPAPLPSSPPRSASRRGVEVEVEASDGEEDEEEEEASSAGAFCLGLESITAVSTSRGLLTREEAEEAERRQEAAKA